MYCSLPHQVLALKENLVTGHYSMKDGLPDDGINSVMQDSHGFIWLGTFSGLCKYDGYKFTTYRNDPASSNSLGNNVVRKVLEDNQGRLWIWHDQGIDVFDPRTEKFYFHWPVIGVGNIHEQDDGKILICTTQGTYLASPETFFMEKIDVPENFFWYNDTTKTQDGSVWVASRMGVFLLNKKNASVIKYFPDHEVPFGLLLDKQERIWIARATPSGLDLFNPDNETFTHYMSNFQVDALLEDADGKMWVGTREGLYILDPEREKLIKINNEYITSLLMDHQDGIWAGSLHHGLSHFYPQKQIFNIYREFGNVIGFLIEDAKHDIWMLNYGPRRNLIRFDPDFKNAQIVPNTGMRGSIFTDTQGSVWLASTGKLEKLQSGDGKVLSRFFLPKNEEPITSYMDSYGTIWIGGWSNNLSKYTPGEHKFEKVTSFPAGTVYTFLEDSHGNLWIGSSAGLVRYRLENSKLDVFVNDPAEIKSLSNNTVFSLIIDRDSTIWVGTGGGLNKIVKGTENDAPEFINWRTTQSGLPNDDIYSIVDGGDGTLWMTCGNMISHFNPQKNIFRNYDHSDGLSGKNFRGRGHFNGSGLRTAHGTIAFGSSDGLVVFHPDSLYDNAFIPPTTITNFLIHDNPVPLKNIDLDTMKQTPPPELAISYTKEVRLAYHQNDFTFEFAALNFVNPERNEYKYKLEPYERDWITTNASNRFARYTNINPGTYTFRVIGSNNDGIWNEEGTSLVVVITPPWWQTWWAYTLYAFALSVVFLYWRSYEIKRLKLRNRAEHLSELDKVKSRFFANISHEFRTPITLILGPLKDLYNGKSKEDPKSILGPVIRNGQRLLGLINQLLDLSKIEAGKLKLHTSPTDLVEFLREIASSYESLAAGKKIKYFFYPEVEVLIAYIDAEKMEKVVHNLLSNAFKFTKSEGEIILNLKVDNNHCSMAVKDTGIGIPTDQLNKVFDRFYQVDSSQTRAYEGSGLGMALAKDLVELHKGKISVSSTEGKGTTFTVTILLGKEHLNKDEISDSAYHTEAEKLSDIVVSAGIEPDANELLSSVLQPLLLIVEDNTDMRRYIRKTLSDQYQIVEAENGKVGVKLAEETVPDLIISDIMMPEMDGYKLCELVKTNELTSHIPVILLTAKADRESKLAGLKFGADDYLSKPFDADELKLIVRNLIEERRKMRERFSKEITLEPKQISITSLDEKFLTKVLALIEEHMDDENFSIQELSREAGFSNMHFYRKIKGLSGQTPSQFLRTIRLKRAAELLAKDSDNVTQIAYSVGFSSLSYFNKCFKEQFGVTPGQYADTSSQSQI
ncbi:MAG: two-component regulator propeller domain-containing protein [Cyclobacteriaceae bacterium]